MGRAVHAISVGESTCLIAFWGESRGWILLSFMIELRFIEIERAGESRTVFSAAVIFPSGETRNEPMPSKIDAQRGGHASITAGTRIFPPPGPNQ